MRKYTGTCKSICSYNLVFNFLTIKTFNFCGARLKGILAWARDTSTFTF